ncbi:MAG: alpha/beta hydrolase [Bacteroidetes bacterium MED-G17]|nr:MAG: alpha/beta hydrolase [Bacteroidetes bacterium TMED39]PDH52199.1 MAG: alpha/beta hydrolase [Bacteroidetes bacterium MED-G17]CAI8300884.1 MAG: 4,5:9,10-diseco-3-hydroxy-5,9,17-trioxoandrosta-1 (10),2-diene-4-oate hydrolase [Bacteroidetes bacterium MED-G17]|tara:strand:+ start:9160 stop:9912 length:753 start_codon:yes stop_codon:yes gene_type:complete
MNVIEEGEFKYVEQGQGETLVLLHGLMGALSNWNGVLDHFSKKYRVVIPLLPIFDMPLKKVGVKGLAEYLDRFLLHKNYGEVHLIGNSLGGHVGLYYYANKKSQTKTLTLTGSSGLYERAMGDTYPKRGSYIYIKEKVEVTFYDPKTATRELVDEVFETINNRNRVIRILAMAKSAIRHNMKEDLKTMHLPVCLIWGKNDNITPPQVAEEFRDTLPNAELLWIDKCGHAPMMEHPEVFNKLLDTFLEKHV